MATTEVQVRPSGTVGTVRQEFGATSAAAAYERATAAAAAHARAEVEARYIMAERRPRNIEQFRKRLMDACLKPAFAKKAEYAKPVGRELNPRTKEWEDKFAYGPSIRFIEAALQNFGNVWPHASVVYEDSEVRLIQQAVTDLESNITYEQPVVVQKVVERKGVQVMKGKQPTGEWDPPKGRIVLSHRINSSGDPVFLVVATDDEVTFKASNLLSKALRNNAQRLLPWDIVAECILLARQTVADTDAKDPDSAKREILDYFAGQGVEPVDLEAYLGYSLARPLQPKQISELRSLWKSVANGETTWQEIVSARESQGSEELAAEVRDRRIAELKAQADLAASGETKPAGGETKPATGETKPAAGETPGWNDPPKIGQQPKDDGPVKSPLFRTRS